MTPVDSAFDTVAGLPLHPLVVHAVVVLLPLAAIGAVLMVVWTRVGRRYGPVVVILGAVSVIAAFVAKESGEAFAERVGTPAEHEEFGTWLPWAALAFFAVLLAFWLVDRGIPLNRSRPAWVIVLGVVLILASIGVLALTVVVGHTGAEAAWSGIVQTTSR